MLEALEYYQGLAQKFPSRFLVAPGIIIVLAGLCIWLAGLRWKMIIGALAGVAIAAAGVFAIGNYPVNVVLAISVIGLVIGIIANRVVIGIFGAVCGAVVVLLLLTANSLMVKIEPMVEFKDVDENYDPEKITADDFVSDCSYPTWPDYEIESIPIDGQAAMEITVKSMTYYMSQAKSALASAQATSLAGAAATAIIAIIAVWLIPRLFIAAVSSTLGAAVIFIGMIMLLFYKNSRPITYIADKPHFYASAFGVMVIFGMVVQLILSPSARPAELAEEADGKKGDK